MKKKFFYFLSTILIVFSLLLTIDYIDIDTKYVNRGIIEFDRKNLNSKYSKKYLTI